MRYYNTLNKDIEFIVIQHKIKGTNTEMLGIRYRDGYAVVAKNSKEHVRLRNVPRAICNEYPITYLRQLKFITNTRDIGYIWGRAVQQYYLAKLEAKILEPEEMVLFPEKPHCKGFNKDNSACGNDKLNCSDYCRKHLFLDKRLADDFANRKKFMDSNEKKEFVDGLILKLESLNK